MDRTATPSAAPTPATAPSEAPGFLELANRIVDNRVAVSNEDPLDGELRHRFDSSRHRLTPGSGLANIRRYLDAFVAAHDSSRPTPRSVILGARADQKVGADQGSGRTVEKDGFVEEWATGEVHSLDLRYGITEGVVTDLHVEFDLLVVLNNRARSNDLGALVVRGGGDDAEVVKAVGRDDPAHLPKPIDGFDQRRRGLGWAVKEQPAALETKNRGPRVMSPTTDILYDFIGKAVCGLPLF